MGLIHGREKMNGISTKDIYFDSDGIRLHMRLDRPEKAGANNKCPLCILVHGFTGHMEEDHIIAAQQAMNSKGIAVLRAEMYGHGRSGGTFREHTLFKWITNALAVVKYAKSLDFVSELYMSGHSQGGMLTMLIGGMCPDDFAAILPLSPAWMIPEQARAGEILGAKFDPAHIPESIVGSHWELGGDYLRVAQMIHVEDAIPRYKGRVYIVHGDKDEAVPYSYGVKAAELYENAELVTIHGANHCYNNGHIEEMAAAVERFFG